MQERMPRHVDARLRSLLLACAVAFGWAVLTSGSAHADDASSTGPAFPSLGVRVGSAATRADATALVVEAGRFAESALRPSSAVAHDSASASTLAGTRGQTLGSSTRSAAARRPAGAPVVTRLVAATASPVGRLTGPAPARPIEVMIDTVRSRQPAVSVSVDRAAALATAQTARPDSRSAPPAPLVEPLVEPLMAHAPLVTSLRAAIPVPQYLDETVVRTVPELLSGVTSRTLGPVILPVVVPLLHVVPGIAPTPVFTPGVTAAPGADSGHAGAATTSSGRTGPIIGSAPEARTSFAAAAGPAAGAASPPSPSRTGSAAEPANGAPTPSRSAGSLSAPPAPRPGAPWAPAGLSGSSSAQVSSSWSLADLVATGHAGRLPFPNDPAGSRFPAREARIPSSPTYNPGFSPD